MEIKIKIGISIYFVRNDMQNQKKVIKLNLEAIIWIKKRKYVFK